MRGKADFRNSDRPSDAASGERLAHPLLRHSPDAVLVADAGRTVVFANAAAEALFDRSPQSMDGMAATTLMPDWPTGRATSSGRLVETTARRGDGFAVPVEATFASWKEGRVRLTGAIIRSVLDRKVAEAMLDNAQAQARQVEAELRAAHRRLSEVVEMQPHGICVLDAEDRYVLWNAKYCELYPEIAPLLKPGIPFLDILEASLASGQMPESAPEPARWMADRLARHAQPTLNAEQKMRDGRWIRYDDRRLSDGSTIGVRVDITDLKRREESFRLLFDGNPATMLLLEPATKRILAVNDAALRQYGFTREEFLAMSAPDLHVATEAERAGQAYEAVGDADTGKAVWRHRLANGGEISVMMLMSTVALAASPSILVAVTDVSERMRAEARIAYLAHHDALTGLANRIRFHQALHAALRRGARSGTGTTLLLLDLDGFKPVNDTFGHAVGDRVLELVAGRLRSATRNGDLVARLGGDEFALLQGARRGDPAETASRIVEMFRAPFAVGASTIRIGVSIGIATAEPGGDGDQLLSQADAALYEAKGAGRNTWRHHSTDGSRRV